MKEIKRIPPKPLAKILGALYAATGFVIGAVFSLISIIAKSTGELQGGFGIAAIVALPIFYGIVGLVMGYVIASVYNFVAKRIGGIQFEIG